MATPDGIGASAPGRVRIQQVRQAGRTVKKLSGIFLDIKWQVM